jgi:hypothetical protein
LPYHAYLEEYERNPIAEDLLSEMLVLISEAPLIFGFKYVAADIDSDACIFLLTKLRKAFDVIKKHGIVKLENEPDIIDRLLQKAWAARGLYPSLLTVVDIVSGRYPVWNG